MVLQLPDILVITLYLVLLISIGIFSRNNIKGGKSAYLLGSQKLPWWMIGISNASGMFDISGTLWMVSILFVYGIKSIWFPWLWPVFNQVFMFVYLAVWLRRSNVSTGAEWILTRFGNNASAQRAHKTVTAFAIISSLAFMAYGFVGIGKFLDTILPINHFSHYFLFALPAFVQPYFYGIILTIIATTYAILGGMASIVWADVIQYILMVIASIIIAAIAMTALSGQNLSVPEEWNQLFFSWNLNLHWPQSLEAANQKIAYDNFKPFGLFFSLMAAKGILSSLAGSPPSYDMQKILSTKSPREAALASMFVNVVLLPTRYLMIAGFTVLGILHFQELQIQGVNGHPLDFEKILPAVMIKFAPPGILGLFIVELLAAFMGTFAGTLNAAQAYIVNDIYLKSVNPNADNKKISYVNYFTGITVALLSIILGIFTESVNALLQWIVGALFSGYLASNLLKWYWWRFNGDGFFWGMVLGILAALILPLLFPDAVALFYFPVILIFSLLGAIGGTLSTPPTPNAVLTQFYKTVNPWGFWKPVKKQVMLDDHTFKPNDRFKLDMFNVSIGTIAQTSISVLPVFIVLLMPISSLWTGFILLLCILILRRTWYDKLPR